MPAGPQASLELDLPVEPVSVPAARAALERLAHEAGASPDAVHALRLAVSEACTNVVLHAYRDRPPGRLRIAAALEDEELAVVVSDDGGGVRPRTDSPGLGLGLSLMAAVAHDLQITVADGANHVAMRFRLDGPPRALGAAA